MKHTIHKFLSAGLLAVNTVHIAYCQGTLYTSRSAFQSALITSSTITFENVPVTQGGPGESIITASGVSFTHPGGLLYVRRDFAPVFGTGNILQLLDGFQPISISLPSGMTAFGADFSGGWEFGPSFTATLNVNLANGSSYAYNFPGMYFQWTFFGVAFDQPISSLIFSDGGNPPIFRHGEMLDNVTFGTVPEPRALALLTLGGLLLGWRRLNRSRST